MGEQGKHIGHMRTRT